MNVILALLGKSGLLFNIFLTVVICILFVIFFFQAEDGIRDGHVTGVQTCALPISLQSGDTLVIATLDRLGRSTQSMLTFAQQLREKGAGLRVLNLGGGDVDTSTPMGSMMFTVMAALAQMELDIKRERITDSVAKRRAAGKDLGGRRRAFTDSQIRSAMKLIDAGEPATQVARDFGMSRATLYRRIQQLPAEDS